MAKMSAKSGIILLDDGAGTPRDISDDCVNYTINYNIEALDVTGFTEGSQNFTPGILVTDVSVTMRWNTAATTGSYTVVKAIMAAALVAGYTGSTLDVTPEGSGLSWAGEVMCTGFSVTGAAQGSPIEIGTVNFKVMGATAPTIA